MPPLPRRTCAGDAAHAAKVLKQMRSEVDGFSAQHEKRVLDKVLASTDNDDGNLAKKPVPRITAKKLSLYDAFNLVCEASGLVYGFGKNQEVVIEQLK